MSTRLRRVADARGVATDDCASDIRVSAGTTKTIDVEPGHYLIEACWRNGSVTTQRCSVGASDVTELLLNAPKKSRRTQSQARDFSHPSAGGMFRGAGRTAVDGEAYSIFVSEHANATWTLLRDYENIASKVQLPSHGRPATRSVDLAVRHAGGSARSWLVYWTCDRLSVSSLPTGGWKEEGTVLRSDPDNMPFVAVSDPDMGTMTDMLTIDDDEAARRYAAATFVDLADGIVEMIDARPLEICAFAYADRDNFADSSWATTLEVVADRHPWLSDACIILGWRVLMTAKDSRDWEKAGDLFERAVEVGVPYYSLGVRLLSEGLTTLAAETSRHGESARLVRTLAARTVRSEAFTTVNF